MREKAKQDPELRQHLLNYIKYCTNKLNPTGAKDWTLLLKSIIYKISMIGSSDHKSASPKTGIVEISRDDREREGDIGKRD